MTRADTVAAPATPSPWVMRGIAIATGLYALLVILMASPRSFYTMDDAYIHLAVAENLTRGVYGVNLDEPSNPSSSIIWPWLMAPFAWTGLLLWAPLLVNIACLLATARLLAGFVIRQLVPAGADAANALIVCGLGFFSFNIFAVAFTGLEHSLHVLVSAMAITRALERRYDWVMFAGMVLSPLVRFEGFAVWAIALAAALHDRRFLFAAAAAGVVAAIVGLWEAWILSQGLPALPSSVLAKSSMTANLVDGGGSLFGATFSNVWENLHMETYHLFGLFAAVGAWAVWKRTGRDRLVGLAMVGFAGAVVVVGKMGGYWRYEVYALVVLACCAIYLMKQPLAGMLRTRAVALALGLGLVALNFASGPLVTITTPLAARNIDRQQHQMHRFAAQCWKRPIAVNDLGWVALHNDQHVLDLAGLGSEAARKARNSGDPDWVGAMMDDARVELAMIYQDWFPRLPADWVKVGEIVLDDLRMTPQGSVVSVFAASPQAVAPARDCLTWLGASTPKGASVRLAVD